MFARGFDIAGRRAVVTGASRGIGAALARELATRGVRVVAVARSRDELQAVVDGLDGRAVAHQADLSSAGDIHALVDRVTGELGGIDILVNNAAIGLYAPVEDLSDELLARALAVNVFAPLALIRHFMPSLVERRGAIVNVSSVLAGRSLPMSGGYSASKCALEALSDSLRAEIHDRGVRVLVARPGRTATGFRVAALSRGWRPPPASGAAPDRVARAIVDALQAGRSRVELTLAGRLLTRCQRLSPFITDLGMRVLSRKLRAS